MAYDRSEKYRVTGRIFVDPKQGDDLPNFLEGFLKQLNQHYDIERHSNRSLLVFVFDLLIPGHCVNSLIGAAETALVGYVRPSDFTVTSYTTMEPVRHLFTKPRLKRALLEEDVVSAIHDLGELNPLTPEFQSRLAVEIKRTTGLKELETIIQVMK